MSQKRKTDLSKVSRNILRLFPFINFLNNDQIAARNHFFYFRPSDKPLRMPSIGRIGVVKTIFLCSKIGTIICATPILPIPMN